MAKAVEGSFLTDRDIEKRNVMRATQLFQTLPGVRLAPGSGRGGPKGGDSPVGRGGRCKLGLVVNGQLMPYGETESFDDLVPIHAVGGIEVYPSAESVPSTLQGYVKGCGLVVVWIKYSR